MRAYSVLYRFSQPFSAPARKAFNWCTDYQPYDLSLMNAKGERRIQKITADTILLKETTYQKRKPIRKTKLVRLNRAQLSWSNTHLSGPNRHSQFLYEIIPVGERASKLSFTGLLLCYSKANLSPRKIKQIAKDERRQDSDAWQRLAKTMAREA